MFSFPLCLLCGSVSSTSKWGMRSLFLYTLGTARPPKLVKEEEEKKTAGFFPSPGARAQDVLVEVW